ncbi:hypothetical protein MMC29_000627 [Sticta canariensis]|nr:hypothetical protein [Sticta canariensis]
MYDTYDTSLDERRFILSVEGCQKLCGSGTQYYPWGQIAGTITTWVLPIIGLLLQAPYESNEFRKTLYALVRWLGSPIASQSYILWNIKVIGKCAILSDMSVFYSLNIAKLELEDAERARDIRDSLYILSVMNQYTVKSPIDPIQAETLLRVALFADINTPTLDLKERRRKLAMALREGRKRGIVPVFITLMWIGEKSADKSRKQTQNLVATLNWIFRFCELVNTAWLIYIVMAQTLGSYETCACLAALWTSHGGYIDAKVAIKADSAIVEHWCITGALLSSLIMFTAIAYLVIEWCEQSHLNTVDLNKAMHGLKLTQHFKYRTLWIRKLWRAFSASCGRGGERASSGRVEIQQ